MQLHAVIVPPRDAIEGAEHIVDGIFNPRPDPAVEPRRGGLRGRLRKSAPAEVVPEVIWSPTPREAVFVRVAKFGNVTLTDTRTLVRALEGCAPRWPRSTLHVATVTVGETEPFTVTAQLEGDLNALGEVFSHVLDVAKQQDFFLDRRSFRTAIQLGSVEVPPGGEVPEGLPGAVIPCEGPSWQASHLTLFRLSGVGGAVAYEEVAAIALGQPAEHAAPPARRQA